MRLARAGFEPARDLYEMRVSLPLAEEPKWPGGITVRDFEPGTRRSRLARVNNRAFENHPEQGAWIEATLERRLAEDWFDPSLFVLAFDDATGSPASTGASTTRRPGTHRHWARSS